MSLTKGDFSHFVTYYGNKVDGNDFDWYFKPYLSKKYGLKFCNVMRD